MYLENHLNGIQSLRRFERSDDLDKQMPPYNKIVDSILNDKEENISSDTKDDIVKVVGFELHVGDAKTT